MIIRFSTTAIINARNLLTLIAVIICGGLTAQLEISGTVMDSTDATPLVGAYAMLLKQPSATVMSYALTDANGQYTLRIDSSGAYQVSVSYLGYRKASRDVVYDGVAARRLTLDLAAVAAVNNTRTVVVTAGRPPIIVQGDTTTFAVDHWADVDDQDLEAVLKKMPGFSVAEDGELSYRGKKIEKVVIDGKEVANVGAALLTRGISADKVANVQVRQHDQNSKLKQDLLDKDGIMVLDIQLKEAYQFATFGRVRAGAGVSPNVNPIGYGSAFRLKKKSRMHLLAEYNTYGEPKIAIAQIKNLGREAYAEIFNTPADFSRLRQRAEYDRQIYGFSQFTEVEDATVALSLNTDLGKHLRLFAGSYQNLDASAINQSGTQQFFNDDREATEFRSSTEEHQRRFDSRNKIELDYSRDSFKLRYNVNGLFANDRPEQTANYTPDGSILYAANRKTWSVYQNLHVSSLFGSGGGAKLDVYQSISNNRNLSVFSTTGFDDFTPFNALGDGEPLQQRDDELEKILIAKAGVSYPLLFGFPVTLGYRYLDKEISGERRLLGEAATNEALAAFTGLPRTLRLRSHFPHAKFSIPLSFLKFSTEIGYNFYTYPTNGSTEEAGRKDELLEYKFSAEVSKDFISAQLSYQRQVSSFPLAAMRAGTTFSRFDLLNAPTTDDLRVLPEQVAQLAVSTYALERYGIVLDGAVLYGEANTSPDIFTNGSSPTATRIFAQNPSRYWVTMFKQAKVFQNSPLVIRLEQGYIDHRQSNTRSAVDDGSYQTNFTALLLKSEIVYTPKEQAFNFNLGYEHNVYGFSNDLSTDLQRQTQHNLDARVSYRLFEDQLRIGLNFRRVILDESKATSSFDMLGASIRYSLKKGILQLRAENLFDVRSFERRVIDPVVFSVHQRSIFGRMLYLTYQFDF